MTNFFSTARSCPEILMIMPLREYEAVLRPHRHEMRDHQGIDAGQVSPEMSDTGTIVHLD